jgi:hypothetical protein
MRDDSGMFLAATCIQPPEASTQVTTAAAAAAAAALSDLAL